MNSTERRKARFERRTTKRELAKLNRNKGHGFADATSFGALKCAYYKARKGVGWKTSVLRYGENIIRNSYLSSHRLQVHAEIRKGFVKFYVMERGKKRFIQSVHISERVIQKAVCDRALVPVMEQSLIYDNGASQVGKGTEFATLRVIEFLHRYYRRYHTNEAWVVVGDGHAFFDSLQHDVIRANGEQVFTDVDVCDLEMLFVDAFDYGLGLGSQVSQINAVAYCNRIDHYITEMLRPEGYVRYMDDWVAICRTKEEAERLLADVIPMYEARGIQMNPKKTQIVKLTKGFTWLKDRLYLTDTGKVIRKPCHSKPARDRRKLKKMVALMEEGELRYENVRSFAGSVKGYYWRKSNGNPNRRYLRRNGYRSWREFAKLYNELVIDGWLNKKQEDITNEQNIVSEQERRRTGHSGSAYVPDQKREHRDLVFL